MLGPYWRILLLILLGGALGALWVMASWIGSSDFLESLPGVLAGFFVLGAIAQFWLAPGPTGGLAVAFLAGQLVATNEYNFRTNAELEGFGEYPPVFFFVLVILGVAVTTALFGHWLAGVLQRRLSRPSAP